MTLDDYVESPFVELGDAGNGQAYNHTPQVQKAWQMPERDWDDLDVKLGLIDQLPPEPVNHNVSQAAPITQAQSIELRWAWNQTSNIEQQGQERNRLRYGKLITGGQNYVLWGMATWYEAKRHIHTLDKPLIMPLWEELVYEVSQRSQTAGDHRSCFWCARSQSQTRQGFWAISIETDQAREIIVYANETITTRVLPIKAINKFKLAE